MTESLLLKARDLPSRDRSEIAVAPHQSVKLGVVSGLLAESQSLLTQLGQPPSGLLRGGQPTLHDSTTLRGARRSGDDRAAAPNGIAEVLRRRRAPGSTGPSAAVPDPGAARGQETAGVIRRVIDEDALIEAFELQAEIIAAGIVEIQAGLVELIKFLSEFLASGDQAIAHTLVETANATEKAAIDLREDMADEPQTSPLGRVRALAQRIARETIPADPDGDRLAAKQKYTGATEPNTLMALQEGKNKHLLISPQPGLQESEAVKTYPADAGPEDRMQLSLPGKKSGDSPFKKITVSGTTAPPVLDILVIGGGHGGVDATFEQDTYGHFDKQYWIDSVVQPMVDKKIKAHLIVLDACLTVSMIDVFAPLCSDQGKIIASMYSINRTVLSPEIWAEIFKADGPGKRDIAESAAQQVATTASDPPAIGIVAKIAASSPDDLRDFLVQEPSIAPVVSTIRYLPRIVDAVAGHLRAKSDLRRKQCVDELREMSQKMPPLDPDQEQLADMAADLLEYPGNESEVLQLVQRYVQGISGSTETDLAALRKALVSSSPDRIKALGLADVPAHIAVYEHAAKEIRFDEKFKDPAAQKRVEGSTGAESANEMKQISAALLRMQNDMKLTLREVSADKIVKG